MLNDFHDLQSLMYDMIDNIVVFFLNAYPFFFTASVYVCIGKRRTDDGRADDGSSISFN